MIPFLTKRKIEKAARLLEGKLLEQLQSKLPDFQENHQHWVTKFIRIEDARIVYNHISYEPTYVEKNKKRHNRNYILKNLQVKRVGDSQMLFFDVSIELNLISTVQLTTKHLHKVYDMDSIDVRNIIIEEVVYENDDKKMLLSIIGHLPEEQLGRLEVDDCLEIELGGKKYYTILDMEDGNYIAVNKKGKVYRLHHDSSVQVEIIAATIDAFLLKYQGDKENLTDLFE